MQGFRARGFFERLESADKQSKTFSGAQLPALQLDLSFAVEATVSVQSRKKRFRSMGLTNIAGQRMPEST